MNRSHVPPWDPADAEPGSYLYVAMADHIEARIRAGDLPASTRLPNERALAAEYGVSIDTSRRAVARLRDRGLVVTAPAKGTFVAGPNPRR